MRVLIATVNCGAGHLSAGAALEEAWRAAHPDDAVEKIDLLKFPPASPGDLFGRLRQAHRTRAGTVGHGLLPYRVEQLLGSKKLGEMGKVAKSLGRTNAAQAICVKCWCWFTEAEL